MSNVGMSHLVPVWFYIDRPLMCVSIILSLFPKVAGNVPKHDRLHNGYSLQIKETTNINAFPSETITERENHFFWFKINPIISCETNARVNDYPRMLYCNVVTLTRPPESGPNSVIFLNIVRKQHDNECPVAHTKELFVFHCVCLNLVNLPSRKKASTS